MTGSVPSGNSVPALGPEVMTRRVAVCVVAFSGTDFRRDLEAFTIPVLVLHGDSDAVVPFEASGQRTAAAIPGAETVVIEGGPHGVNASHPAEFNAALLDFLAR